MSFLLLSCLLNPGPEPLDAGQKPQSTPNQLEADHPRVIEIVWSKDGWEEQASKHGYRIPHGAPGFPGKNVVDKLSRLLQRYFAEVDVAMGGHGDPDTQIKKLSAITQKYLELAEKFLIGSLDDQKLNWHQYIHIQEICSTFLNTTITFFDAACGYPDQIEAVTRPECLTFQLHPELCGLLLCRHLLDDAENASAHQEARIPYAPPRTGQEITYEEIANLYRTSRVNVRRIEKDRCHQKLRMRLKEFSDR